MKWAKWRDVDRLVLLGVLAIKRSKLDKNKPVGVSRAPYIGLEVPNSGGEAGRPALYDSTQEKNQYPSPLCNTTYKLIYTGFLFSFSFLFLLNVY